MRTTHRIIAYLHTGTDELPGQSLPHGSRLHRAELLDGLGHCGAVSPASWSCRPICSRRPRPGNDYCFAFAGPGRHRHANGSKRLVTYSAELKSGAERDRQASAGGHFHNVSLPVLLTPHFSLPGDEVPNLLDRPVSDCLRRPSDGKLKVRHASAGEAEQDSHVGTVRREGVSIPRKQFRSKSSHSEYPSRVRLEAVGVAPGTDLPLTADDQGVSTRREARQRSRSDLSVVSRAPSM